MKKIIVNIVVNVVAIVTLRATIIVTVCSSILLPLQAAAESSTLVYTPAHQTAQILARHLAELYNNKSTFTVSEGRLIIRGEKQLVAEIEETLKQLDSAPRIYSLSIASSPPGADDKQLSADKAITVTTKKIYRTQPRKPIETYQVREDTVLRLARQDQQQQLTALPRWLLIESVAIEQEYLELRFKAAAHSVLIDVNWHRKDANDSQSVSSSLTAAIGSWVAIAGESVAEQDSQDVTIKTWRTTAPGEQLYIKISPVTK